MDNVSKLSKKDREVLIDCDKLKYDRPMKIIFNDTVKIPRK